MRLEIRKKFLLTFLFLSNAVMLFAQDGGPGLPDDPGDTDCDPATENCPLDTWIIIFALIVLIVTIIYLYKKQAAAAKLANNN